MRDRFFNIKKACQPDCPDRVSGCHSKCERYIEWKKQDVAIRERIREEKVAEFLATKKIGRTNIV